jgi:hypothetical protein
VPIQRRDGELDLTDVEAALLVAISAATIDRRLAGERAKMSVGGRSHTKPGSLLKSQIPIGVRAVERSPPCRFGLLSSGREVAALPSPSLGDLTGHTRVKRRAERKLGMSQVLGRQRPACAGAGPGQRCHFRHSFGLGMV